MIQGTGSHVGKSVIAAALCRIFSDSGFRVAPFKAQNMSLNSFVTPAGGEIGRAQALQAQAARVDPHTDMNPVLMKPEQETSAQIIFHGRSCGSMNVQQYAEFKKRIFPEVLQSLLRLCSSSDVVVIEGAGSPAEINLRDQDIVNMAIAGSIQSPVVLVGDIDRGGVFASLVGTIELLKPEERKLIRGFLINKFRGDASLLQSGIDFLQQRTGIPVIGVIPYFNNIQLPEEDALVDPARKAGNLQKLAVRVIRLRSMSNFTDFDAIASEPDVDFRYITDPAECSSADLLILPGSKCTAADLNDLHARGFGDSIRAAAGKTVILGICGGFQMLGQRICDPAAVESEFGEVHGFALFPGATIFASEKQTRQIEGTVWNTSICVRGYEIHHGHTLVEAAGTPFFCLNDQPEGYADFEKEIFGTSVHGIFDEPSFRSWFLNRIRKRKGLDELKPSDFNPDCEIQKLADHVKQNINMQLLLEISRDSASCAVKS
jgi:adenosylcobyric acid synthase